MTESAAGASDTTIPPALEPLLRRATLVDSVNGRWCEANPEELPTLDRERAQDGAWLAENQKVPWRLGGLALMLAGDDLAPALREWLTVRATNLAKAPAEGSVGDVLEHRLAGLEVVDGDRRVRIERTFAEYRNSRLERILVLLRFEQAGSAWLLCSEIGKPDAISAGRRARVGWRDIVEAQVRALLVSLPGQPVHDKVREFADRLGDTVTPDIAPGTFAHWLGTRGGALLAAGPIARAEVRRKVFEVYVREVRIGDGHSGAAIRSVIHVQKRRGEDVLEATELEHLFYPLDAEAFDRPAPNDEQPAIAFVEVWRAAMSGYLETLVKELGADLFAIASYGPAFIGEGLFLMAKWLEHGPPSAPAAPPTKPKPALAVTKKTIETAAESVRHLAPQELDALRAKVDPQIAAGLAFGEWLVLLCPEHRSPPGTGTHDRILMQYGDGAPVEIVRNDPWNGHYMPIDGDAETFRAFARFLRGMVKDSPSDVDLVWNEEELRLSAWLEFPNPDPDVPPPVVDSRFQEAPTATVRDFIAGFSFWREGNVFGIAGEERERYRTAVGATYHAFLRAVIDPRFPRGATKGRSE